MGKRSESTLHVKIENNWQNVVGRVRAAHPRLSLKQRERGRARSSHAERTNNTKLLCRCRARTLDSKQITEQRISFIIIYSHSQIAMQFSWRELVLAVK